MEWKRIVLLFSIVIIIAAFYRVILNNWLPLLREGLEPNTKGKPAKPQLTESDSTHGIDCSGNDYSSINALPLREYFVKACFNSGYNGSDVSTNTIGRRLAEGYRFLDLNVFSASGGNLYVGFSEDNAPNLVSTSLPFETAMSFIQQWGFTDNPKVVLPTTLEQTLSPEAITTPTLRKNSYSYPLFVHIRVYRAPNSQEDIVKKIANVINKLGYSQFYRDNSNKPVQINGCTTLDKLMGKIVFTMDIENILQIYAPTNTPSAEYVPVETIKSIQSFTNMLTGGSTCLAFYDYSDPQLISKTTKLRLTDPNNAYKTNLKYMYVLFPNPANDINPDVFKLTVDNSIQFIPVRAYLNDGVQPYLTNYTKIFDELKTPFAPMSYVYTTVNSLSSQPKK